MVQGAPGEAANPPGQDVAPRDYIITDPLGAKADGETWNVQVLRDKAGRIEALYTDELGVTQVPELYRGLSPESAIAEVLGDHPQGAAADASKVRPVAPTPPGVDVTGQQLLQDILADPRSAAEIRAEADQTKAAREAAAAFQPTNDWQDAPQFYEPGDGVDLKVNNQGRMQVRLAPEAGTREAPVEVQTPADLDAVAGNINQNATPKQKDAENYEMAHGTIYGLPISVETPKGGTRTAKDGSWSVPDYPAHYGRFKKTKGADGQLIDFFYDGPNPYILDQNHADTGKFDEHKVIFANNEAHALSIYQRAYTDGKHAERLRQITPVTVDQLKAFLDKPQTRPFAKPGINIVQKPRQATGPLTLRQFLASRGGLRPDPGGELKALGLKSRIVVPGLGYRNLIHAKGMTLDQAREAAVEAGYIQDAGFRGAEQTTSTPNELLDMLAAEEGGRDTYRQGEELTGTERGAESQRDADEHRLASVISELQDFVKAQGLLASDEQIREAAEASLTQGIAPDEAIDRVIERDALVVLDQLEQYTDDGVESVPFEEAATADGTGGSRHGVQAPSQSQQQPARPEGQGPVEDGRETLRGEPGQDRPAPRPEAVTVQEASADNGVTREQFEAMADRGRLHKAPEQDPLTPSAADLDRAADNPVDLGRLYGYSEDDIAHFYRFRRRGHELAYTEYIDDLKAAAFPPAQGGPGKTGASVVSEPGAEGKPQLVIPGAERDEAGAAQNATDKPLKPTKAQKLADEGLFGDGHKQGDLLDQKPVVSPAVSQPAEPEGLVERIPGEDGTEVLIVKNSDGKRFNVVMRDTESGETLPTVSIVLTLERARAKAREMLRGPKESGPLAQSLTLRTGKEKISRYGLEPGTRYTTREIAEALERRQRAKYGLIEPGDFSARAMERIAGWMADEAKFELGSARSGAGWYSDKFQRALDHLGEVFPELKDSKAFGKNAPKGARVLGSTKNARDFMTALIAVTSDGSRVADNLQNAVWSYGQFRKTGQLPTEFRFGGDRNASVKGNFRNLQELLDRFGAAGMRDFLLKEDTISALRQEAKKQGRDFNVKSKADAVLPRAAIVFGPKLGAFYANLMGSHGYLTMDRWWSRTFNRYRGTLLPTVSTVGLARFRKLIRKPRLTDEETIQRTVPYRNAYFARGYKNGTEIEKAANTLYKDAFEKLEDSPFNASDREFMVNTVNRAQEKLAKDGINLSIADIQAILWYYEKRLYGELGAQQTADISYQDVAREIAAGRRRGGPATGATESNGARGQAQSRAGARQVVGPDGAAFDVDADQVDGARPSDSLPEVPKGWDKVEATPRDNYVPPRPSSTTEKFYESRVGGAAYGAPAPFLLEHEQQIANAVAREADRILPGVNVRRYHKIWLEGRYKHGSVAGIYASQVRDGVGLEHIIAWSLESENTPHTIRHEAIHYLRHTGLISEKEWAALEAAAKKEGWIEKHGIDTRYGDSPEAMQVEEAIAEEFAGWREEKAQNLPDRLWNVFERIDLFLRRIAAAVRRIAGRPITASDVLTRIETGEVGRRGVSTNTESSAFKKWFGDSKVVDASGEPLVVYHGTRKTVEAFDLAKRGSNTKAPSGEAGFFFTDRKRTANYYAGIDTLGGKGVAEHERKYRDSLLRLAKDMRGRGNDDLAQKLELDAKNAEVNPNVIPAYLSLKNPLVRDFKGRVFRDESFRSLLDRAKAEGHDGAIFKNTFDAGEYNKFDATMRGRLRPETIYVAFEPTQIKSAEKNSGAFSPTDANIFAQSVPKDLGLPTATRDPKRPTYLRVGAWNPQSPRSRNYARGEIEAGLSVYELDANGKPIVPAEGEWAGDDLADRMRGDEPKFIVQGEVVGEGHDGEPLLSDPKVVGMYDEETARPQLAPKDEWALFQNRKRNAEKLRAAEEESEKATEKPEGSDHPRAQIPRSPAEKKVLERVAPSDEKASRKITFNSLYTDIKDDLNPIRVLRNALAENKALPAAKDPYVLARLTRGSYGKAQQFLEHGTFDFNTLQNTGKSLKDILKPVRNDLDGLRAYAVSKRTLELTGRGIKTGVPLKEAQDTVTAGAAKYEATFQELQTYQRALTGYLHDAGIISDQGYTAMLAANKDYVPFFRLMGDTELGSGLGPGLKVKDPVKGIRGSDRKIIDPIESIIKNTYLFVSLAERNRALTALADLADTSPHGADLMPKTRPNVHPIHVTEQEIGRFLTAQGVDPQAAGSMTIFRPNPFRPNPNEIALFRNGKREIRTVDTDVAEAVNALDRESHGILVRLLAIPARTLRAGAVLAPEFIARNPVRDQFEATLMSEHGYIPIWDLARGMGALFKRSDNYQRWLKAGGANAALVGIDRDYINQNVLKLEKPGALNRVKNVVRSPLEFLRMLSEFTENATRLGEFIRATGKGKDPFTAGYASREVTLDFARMGAQTRAINMIIPFWNAQVEGNDRLVRGFAKAPGRTLLKATLAITLPSVLLWWANHDDDRWKEMPAWQRDLFWIILTDKWEPHRIKEDGKWRDATDDDVGDKSKRTYMRKVDGKWQINNGTIWRIPKPFSPGLLFGSIPERLLDAYADASPKAFKNLGKTVAGAVFPNFIPQAVQPLLEQWANRSFFLDRPIVPKYLEDVRAKYQSTGYTTETAKLIGAAISKITDETPLASFGSPLVLENYVRSWTGNLGMSALQLVDKGLTAIGAVPEKVEPTKTWADMPLIRAFAVRYPSGSVQSVQDFYDEYANRKVALTTMKYLAKSGNAEGAEAERTEHAVVTAEKIHQALGVQSKLIRGIYADKELTADDKRTLIDQTYLQMIELAKIGNQIFDATAKKK